MNKKIMFGVLTFIIITLFISNLILVLPLYLQHRADDSLSTYAGINEIVESNNKFAFDLYNEMNKLTSDNVFFSPNSISLLFAMINEHPNNQTNKEIKNSFYLTEKEILRPNSAAIYNIINKWNKKFTLERSSIFWVQNNLKLTNTFKKNIKKYYGGEIVQIDFSQEKETIKDKINQLIKKEISNQINNLITEDDLNEKTRTIITDANYFYSEWKNKFNLSVKESGFYINDENEIITPTIVMETNKTLNYASLDKLEIIEIPFKNNELSMFIILPKKGDYLDPETGLYTYYNYVLFNLDFTYEKYNEHKSNMQKTNFNKIYLPYFEIETKHNLKNVLNRLGVVSIFNNQHNDFFVEEIYHKSSIKISKKENNKDLKINNQYNEDETIFNINRPFFFVIEENETNSILFMGNLVNPTK